MVQKTKTVHPKKKKRIQDTALHDVCNKKLLLLNGPMRKLIHKVYSIFLSPKLLTNM